MRILRKVFTWVAYAKTLISLPVLSRFIEQRGKASPINIDGELEHRSAKYVNTLA
jgi:hypothetical protein